MVKLNPRTPLILDKNGNIFKGSIASLEEVNINGIKQIISIRGNNTKNPILLYLHGGPGCSEMGLVRHFNSELEKHFIVVNWDQRATCKSYHKSEKLDREMSTRYFISDTKKLIDILTKRFNKKKVYLVGHSWGTIIGILFTEKYPHLVEKYVGISQVVNMREAENIAYSFILNSAIKSGNKKALKEINKAKWFFPYLGDKYLERIKIESRWILHFGGSIYGKKHLNYLIKILFKSDEYSLNDLRKYLRGHIYSKRKLWNEMLMVDFIHTVPVLKVPVVFIQGKYDYQTPLFLISKYFKKLEAPKKKLIIFDKSAHNPNYEESEKFNKIIINLVR